MGHDTLVKDSAADASAETSKDEAKPKLKRKDYEKALGKLQTELAVLQDWVKRTGERIIVIFEGRDAAGKGGTIRALTERVSPRTFRVVALPAPSDREKSQMYVQRYFAHFPAAGEIVIFDRSWNNRAGVEYVMGFCTKEQHKRFLEICPEFEKYITPDRPGGGGDHDRPGDGGGHDRPSGGYDNDYYFGWDNPVYGYGATTGLAVGTYVYGVPSNCVYEVHGGVQYRRCGDVWYQPLYEDVGIRYIVIERPF